ncbi:MAG: response regulator [Verrucomicrobiota bacterium]|jgi:two-component system response regulator
MQTESEEILLVEDSPDDVAFFVHTFKKAGLAANLQVMRDGAEALEYIFCTGRHSLRNAANRPKVIVLDLKLPMVDGLEVLRRLKSDPRTRTIPVVVLSSSQEESDVAKSHELGVNSYVVKPMDFEEFGQSVGLLGRYWLHFNQAPKG